MLKDGGPSAIPYMSLRMRKSGEAVEHGTRHSHVETNPASNCIRILHNGLEQKLDLESYWPSRSS